MLWNAAHLAFVKAQLYLKDVMTDGRELEANGFEPAQLGDQICPVSGEIVPLPDDNSVFGQYSGRSSRIGVDEVFRAMTGGRLDTLAPFSHGASPPAASDDEGTAAKLRQRLQPQQASYDRLGAKNTGGGLCGHNSSTLPKQSAVASSPRVYPQSNQAKNELYI